MISKSISEINEDDILQLRENSVPEGRSIEYKEYLPGSNDENKKEFLADISSFANCDGGIVFFGVKEEKGIPIDIPGVDIEDDDKLILQYDSIIRDSIVPRINVALRIVIVQGRKVLIIKIKKSWNKPHRINFRGWDKFFSRNSAGKYPLDVDQLRNLFLSSDDMTEKIRKHVFSRIVEIESNTSFARLEDCGKLAIFIVPANAFSDRNEYEVYESRSRFPPPHSSGWNNRINIDGILNWSQGTKDEARSYVQVYRNGIIEAVNSSLLSRWGTSEKLFIPSSAYETTIIDSVKQYLIEMKRMGISVPLFLWISFINIRGYILGIDRSRYWEDSNVYDRELLLLPELIIDDYEVDIESLLRSSFTLVWNAFGFLKCGNYSEDGQYIRR
jgi:Predicted transcriptional regulator containing an HTH domain and an uncharacterized domain shared with the mammalian protein Schlafen